MSTKVPKLIKQKLNRQNGQGIKIKFKFKKLK